MELGYPRLHFRSFLAIFSGSSIEEGKSNEPLLREAANLDPIAVSRKESKFVSVPHLIPAFTEFSPTKSAIASDRNQISVIIK